MSGSDDDIPQLSAASLAALQEFYKEQAEHEEELRNALEGKVDQFSPQENWLSQFWYDDATADRLAREALAVAGDTGRIACLSCPTTYKRIRELKSDGVTVYCFEYDDRFKVYGADFVFYNYAEPLSLSEELKNSFDIVLADPPFLSEECLCKMAITIRYLMKDKVLLCTGAVMAEMAERLLGVKPTKFQPGHTNLLQNEFRCFTNYAPLTLDTVSETLKAL